MPTGKYNAITDVKGISVSHVTLVSDDPVAIRTGVTVIQPVADEVWKSHLAAGFHRFNGGGEMTGTLWVEEAGMLTSPICLTSVWSVGIVRDTLLRYPILRRNYPDRILRPMVAETNDSILNHGVYQAVTPDHVIEALETTKQGPVAEGAVGSGTGMMAFEFKSGIGTSSRLAATPVGEFTIGVLVQANFGARDEFRIDGVPIGREIDYDQVPSPRRRKAPAGSIIIIVATDAPLLPTQCNRLAQRAAIGLGRVGGIGHNLSGDLTLAFATGNRFPNPPEVAMLLSDYKPEQDIGLYQGIEILAHRHLTPLFQGVVEATEEAIINSLTMAHTMTGVQGRTVHALPLDRVAEIMKMYGHAPTPGIAR
jgi:D-aminopeptidase